MIMQAFLEILPVKLYFRNKRVLDAIEASSFSDKGAQNAKFSVHSKCN